MNQVYWRCWSVSLWGVESCLGAAGMDEMYQMKLLDIVRRLFSPPPKNILLEELQEGD